jgi:predicted dinucleotide-binding enzyme
VDAGSLEDGRRMQPGSPVYGAEGTAAELLELLEGQ